jgi:hypothetical protein
VNKLKVFSFIARCVLFATALYGIGYGIGSFVMPNSHWLMQYFVGACIFSVPFCLISEKFRTWYIDTQSKAVDFMIQK